MDLFSITCTTCKSRLKVRDESAIGQILGCPKCGGMVMVRAPKDWQPAATASEKQPYDSTTATATMEMSRPAGELTLGDSSFDDVAELLSDAPPRVKSPPAHVTPEGSTIARPRFVGAPPTPPPASPAGKSPDDVAADNLAAAAAATLAPPPPGETDATLLPPPDWSAPHPGRYWALIAGSVALGIVLAFVAVSAAIYIFGGDTGPIAKSRPSPETPLEEIPAPGIDQDPADDAVVDPPAPDVATPADRAPTEPADPVAIPAAPANDSDPLGLVKDPAASPEPQPANPNDPLAKFDHLIGGNVEDPLVQPENPMADPAEPIPAVETGADSSPAPRPPPREVDVPARLADPLAGIETDGTPLADFLRLASDISTIPITLEPDALPFIKATPESPVVLKATGTTVGRALTDALAPLGLESVIVDQDLIVRVVEPSPPRTYNYPVQDLADDAEQMAALAQMLRAVVAPESWAASEEPGSVRGSIAIDPAKGTLAIQQRMAVHIQLLVACEKLRLARGGTPVSRYDRQMFRLDSRSSRARAPLAKRVSLNFQQPTRLVTMLEQLGQAAGARILVDWQDAATAGWNPDGEATLLADKQPLAEALDALLDPLDLAWRVVDERTIQVVTPQRLNERLELEVYKVDALVGDDPEGESLVARVRAALGEGLFQSAGGTSAVRFDVEGRCLLVSVSQPKQRELEGLLEEWRGETASPAETAAGEPVRKVIRP